MGPPPTRAQRIPPNWISLGLGSVRRSRPADRPPSGCWAFGRTTLIARTIAACRRSRLRLVPELQQRQPELESQEQQAQGRRGPQGQTMRLFLTGRSMTHGSISAAARAPPRAPMAFERRPRGQPRRAASGARRRHLQPRARSICFVITSGGKHREVWAAQTRDRDRPPSAVPARRAALRARLHRR
jgi:hypothetical protein